MSSILKEMLANLSTSKHQANNAIVGGVLARLARILKY